MGAGVRAVMVPARGFEPRFTASKAAVLPLDETGKMVGAEGIEPPMSWSQTKRLPTRPRSNVWVGRRELNPQRSAPQADALPIELRPKSNTAAAYGYMRAGAATTGVDVVEGWSPRPESNQQPTAYKADALPIELRGRTSCLCRQSWQSADVRPSRLASRHPLGAVQREGTFMRVASDGIPNGNCNT